MKLLLIEHWRKSSNLNSNMYNLLSICSVLIEDNN